MEEFDIGVMDQAKSKGSGEILDHVDERVDEDFNQLVEGNAIDAGGGHSLGEGVKGELVLEGVEAPSDAATWRQRGDAVD